MAEQLDGSLSYIPGLQTMYI